MRLVHAGLVSIGTLLIAGGIMLAAHNVISAADEPPEIVKERQQLMKQNGASMKIIAGFVKGGAGTLDDVAAAAGQIAENALKIPDLFPPGSEDMSAAKPAIWEKWDEFLGDADTLEREALGMRELALAGDADGVAAQLEVLGTEGCGGCHETFKQKTN
jgi:cytochrome c556